MSSQQPNRRNWSRWSLPALLFTLALGAVACGDDLPPRPDAGPVVDAGPVDAGPVDAGPTDAGPKEIPPASLADCDDSSSFQTVLAAAAAQPGGGGGGGGLTEFTIHYQRKNGDYEGWQVHTWGIAVDPGWNNGHNPVSTTPANGFITFKVPLNASTGELGYLFHKGETKDHDAQDQKFVVDGTVSEIWRIEGDSQTYTSAPTAPQTPDITRVRVTYQRFDKAFDKFGLHLWEGSGVDVSALSGVTINNWDNPVPFSSMPGYAAAADGASVSFDIPILNPKTNASYTKLEFIIHGTSAAPGGTGNKDGWSNNIAVDYLALSGNAADGAGKIWLVQETAEVFYAQPDLAQVSTTDMKAYWLTQDLIKWPRVDAAGSFKLYTSATGQLVVAKGQAVKGHDGALELEVFTGTVPEAAATRFKFVPPGVVLKAKALRAALSQAHTRQLVLAQLDAAGKVLNATVAQTPGALDELYAKAHSGETEVKDLGVKVGGGTTAFKVWAPTAQRVAVCVYDSGSGAAASIAPAAFDGETGVWSVSQGSDLSGKYYKYLVDVYVRGTGLVRNKVTDPYAISLTTDSRRGYIADLGAANLKPEGWDADTTPTTTPAQEDMVIYELHVRDFSLLDQTVPAQHRGKYLGFTHADSNGMKHLKALAQAGLTDVHLLPIFDLATIPEQGCTSPAITLDAPASTGPQAAVAAVKDEDCFNWGYDPYHYTAPEGSYATDASDGAVRIRELRQMVMAMHQAGLRVGMDVVYNHTTASGQSAKSVLDRVVPDYYHRLNAAGAVERSTCCDNTATENAMMGKLMIDSARTWATAHHIDSFRFDLMAHQPRAVMERLRDEVNAATGRSDFHIIGEGWNFGEVQNGTRFVQASQLSLNGSGIGTFSDRARDAIRGGGPFDSGNALRTVQGFLNGLHYATNDANTAQAPVSDLLRAGDMVRVGLAGSIRSYELTTADGTRKTLESIQYGGGDPAGYVTDPQEVVNYFENHDNQTFFDINVYKLHKDTSKADRVRVQMLASAINALSQGVAYYHAGVEVLRSKSMDRNSYNSGDWFNRLDWTYQDNFFATGLPPAADNEANWPLMTPLLQDANIKPGATEIAQANSMFRDVLAIRKSSTLFRMRSADDIKQRLTFHNVGTTQEPTVIVGHLDGAGYAGAGFAEVVYLVNADVQSHAITVDALKGKAFDLHPVQKAGADSVVKTAAYDAATGAFTVPARTAAVFVVP